MINVTRTYLPPIEDYIELLRGSWESRWITNGGPLVKRFSADLASYIGCPFTEFVSNGTIAIQIALKALGLSKGEIITTPYSYVATTTSILWQGCTPRFVDIDESLCIDASKIEDAITSETVAILATHVYGLPCDVARIDTIAKKFGLHVIYDGAHALGCSYKGSSLLSYGDISTLSLHATKLIHSVEGGAIVVSDPELFKKVSLLGKFGHLGEDEYVTEGINAKNSELHAAMGILTLRVVDELIDERKKLSNVYDENLAWSNIVKPNIPSDLTYNYAYYPIFFDNRNEMLRVRDVLKKEGINCRRYFYPSLNRLPYLDKHVLCPNSEKASETVLCLPMYNGLSEESVVRICSFVK